jgi:hypothetical protein
MTTYFEVTLTPDCKEWDIPFPEGTQIWLTVDKEWSDVDYLGEQVFGQCPDNEEWDEVKVRYKV